MKRSPTQTLLITAAVVAGLLLGTRALARWRSGEADAQNLQAKPDVLLHDVLPEQLAAAGYRLDERSPKTWRSISVRLHENDQGFVNILRCRLDPAEAATLIAFPVDARRTIDGLPPADWPWGAEGDTLRVPAWWKPSGRQSRCAEQFSPEGAARGAYADYDPETGWYHCWSWSRRVWTAQRPDVLRHLVADELASGLADLALRARWPADAEGWLAKDGVTPIDCGPLTARLPAGVDRIDVRLLPLAGRHRYLLRIVGLDQPAALRLLAEVPMRQRAADGDMPVAAWADVAPPGGLPAWFRSGPGPRWAYTVVRLGDGAVERGRWAAYAPGEQTLLIWDWDGPAPLPATADLAVQ